MPNTPQSQNQQEKYSNQGNPGQKKEDPTGKTGNNREKDEPTAQGRPGDMKSAGGSCSSSDKQSSKSGCE